MNKLANISKFESVCVHNGLFRSPSQGQFRREAGNLFQKLQVMDGLTYSAMTTLVGMFRTQPSANNENGAQMAFQMKWIQNKLEKLCGGLDDTVKAYNNMVTAYKKGR